MTSYFEDLSDLVHQSHDLRCGFEDALELLAIHYANDIQKSNGSVDVNSQGLLSYLFLASVYQHFFDKGLLKQVHFDQV